MNKNKKIRCALITIIVILSLFTVILFLVLVPQSNSSLEKITEDLNLKKAEIDKINDEINQNFSRLNELQSGDNYELHDPLYEEMMSFIENDTSTTVNEIIDKAKNKGLQSALAEVVVGDNLEMYELIGFNTTDGGLIYFESETKYQVIPVIGDRYINCVVGRPYKTSLHFYIIQDILVIW